MNFQDLHEYDGHMTYPASNENLSSWKEALAGIQVERAAGICSGGEVSFFCVLPLVKEQLVLIDHSYASLYYALGKHHVIEKYSGKKACELFRGTHPSYDRRGYKLPNPLKVEFDAANKDLPTKDCGRHGSFGLSGIWQHITPEEVTNFKRNRKKVSFLHGDINDLADLGPFDLLYLSNALDYSGRDGDTFQIDKIVKPGGYVMFCYQTSYYNENTPPRGNVQKHIEGWEPVAKAKTPRTAGYGLSWTYEVRRTPKEVTDAPQVAPSS